MTPNSVAPINLSSHPGIQRMLTAIRSGELGLLRAVHADLVWTGPPDDGATLIETVAFLRAASGPGGARLLAAVTDRASWTLLGKTEREIVISMNLLRLESRDPAALLRGVVRINGTHGSARVDLMRPALQIRTVERTELRPFSVETDAEAAALTLEAETMRGLEQSASSGLPVNVLW